MKQSRTIEEIERKQKFMSCSKYYNSENWYSENSES